MLAARRGSIINIASIYGLTGFYPGFPAGLSSYAASKGALIALTRQCAVEYAADGIRVNAIAPGYHGGTNLGHEGRSNASPEHIARLEGAIRAAVPMGRRGTPDELEGLAIYLASDASSYMTGQVFANDGGWTAQ
jgi:NAD(P)-dependent dehydrogenase (short-subunit alcohol dehydrogenase family)